LSGRFEIKIYNDLQSIKALVQSSKKPSDSSAAPTTETTESIPSNVSPPRKGSSRPQSSLFSDNKDKGKRVSFIDAITSFTRLSSATPTIQLPPVQPIADDINIKRLNWHLNTIDPNQVRERRQLFNFVYQEIMSFEEPGRGLPFDSVLQVLSYKLIDAERYLKCAFSIGYN
jgi:hypothetical protein